MNLFPSPLVLIFVGVCILLSLVLLVICEISRNNKKRENEVMFGSDDFDKKSLEFALTEKEKHTMDKLVRRSVFSNKDALFNSANLFEDSVNRFYEFRNIDKVRDITLDSVTDLRKKLGFTVVNENVPFVSTRQFEIGLSVKLLLEGGIELPLIVSGVNEKIFRLRSDKPLPPLPGKSRKISVRWIRLGDAIYTIKCEIYAVSVFQVSLRHETHIEKFQLRRWVRESVEFETIVDYRDGFTGFGCLFDLSAGGILVGLDRQCKADSEISISFDLPGYGRQDVNILILRPLVRKNEKFPNLILHSAAFVGEFGWIQEQVLQYIFEVRKPRK